MRNKLASGLVAVVLLMSSASLIAAPVLAFDVKVPNPIQRYGNRHYGIMQGNVTAINGTSLTVALQDIYEHPNGKTITVNTDSNTKFRRRFWGDSNFSEISVGDHVNVKGTWTDDAHTTLLAGWVRDTSIMKRFGTFVGVVLTKSDTSFTFDPNHRGNQTVYFDSNTKFVNNANQAIAYGDIKVGDRVRVKGMWDKKLHKLTEVKQVKDFSINNTNAASPNSSSSTTSGTTN